MFRLCWAFFRTIHVYIYIIHKWQTLAFSNEWHTTIDGIWTSEPHDQRANDNSAELRSLVKLLSNSPSRTAQGSPPFWFMSRLYWDFFSTIHIYIYYSQTGKTRIDSSTNGIPHMGWDWNLRIAWSKSQQQFPWAKESNETLWLFT